jgi:hypothetical protein
MQKKNVYFQLAYCTWIQTKRDKINAIKYYELSERYGDKQKLMTGVISASLKNKITGQYRT